MLKKYSRYIILIFFLGDLFILNASYACSFYLRFGNLDRLFYKDSVITLFISNLVWCLIVFSTKAYQFIRIEKVERIVSRTIQLVVLFLGIIFFVIVALRLHDISRLRMLYFFGLFLSCILLLRMTLLQTLKAIRKSGYNFKTVIIVGMGKAGLNLFYFLSKDLSFGYKILGFFDDDPEDYSKKFTVLGSVSQVKNYLKDNTVDEVYITGSDYSVEEVRKIIDVCEHHLIRIKFVPNFNRYTQTRRVSIDFYGNIPVVSLRTEPLEKSVNRIFKRSFDILFSLVLMVFLFSWLFPLLAIAVKLSSKGPVFFCQERSGEENKTFKCWKFRTMEVNDEADILQATKNDSRVTAIGRIFRKTNLDELPQFFNVLKGDMSVVGPRPHMLKHTEQYSALIKNYLVRHFVKPGITGWSQVNGLRGEITELEQMETRVEYDIWYIENWSFMLDLKIAVKTITNMIKGDKNAI